MQEKNLICSWTDQIDVQSRENWLWEWFSTYPIDRWLNQYPHHVSLRVIPLTQTSDLSIVYVVSSVDE